MANAKYEIKNENVCHFFVLVDGVETRVEALKTMGGFFKTRRHIPVDAKLVTSPNGMKVTYRKSRAGKSFNGSFPARKVIEQVIE